MCVGLFANMELVASSKPVKMELTKIHFPRKMKKRLKKIGAYPQFCKIWEVENNTTAEINNVMLGD